MRLPKFLTKKKLISLFILCSLLFVLFTKPISAYSTKGSSYQLQFENAVFNTEEMNLQSFVYETMKATAGSVVATIYCFSCEDRNLFKGLLGFTGSLIVGVYANPPASGIQYLAYLGNKLGIAQPVYAQEGTIGWDAMKNLLPIWSKFRDLAYTLFIIIFIFIGFAIMFRLKISPQAVVTIETALPKIIIALLLVTFSYAIVGFLIDFMYVLFSLITFVFLGDGGIIQGQFGFIEEAMNWIEEFIVGKIGSPITQAYFLNGIFLVMTVFLAFLFALISGPGGWIIALLGILVSIIVIFRCFLAMIKAWANVIISLIFAPLIITMGALPGSNAIGDWFKNLLANLAVLPIMYTMLLLCCFFILSGIKLMFANLGTFLLSMATGWISAIAIPLSTIILILSPSDYWQFVNALLMPIIGLMILWMAPKAADMVKSFIMGKPFEYGTAIGEAMGPVVAGGQMFAQARYGLLEAKKFDAEAHGRTLGGKDALERTLYQVMNVRGMIKKP